MERGVNIPFLLSEIRVLENLSCSEHDHLIFTWIDLMLTFHLFIGLAQTG